METNSTTIKAEPKLRRYNFVRRPNTFGASGYTAQDAFARWAAPTQNFNLWDSQEFMLWDWYEIDDRNMPIKGFDSDGFPVKSHGPEQDPRIDPDDSIDERAIVFIRAFTALWPNAEYGPAHILLSDYNVHDDSLLYCLKGIQKAIRHQDFAGQSLAELQATERFLSCLAVIPEDKR